MTPPAAATAAARSDERIQRRPTRPSGPRRISGPAPGRRGTGSREAANRTRLAAAPPLSRPAHARSRRVATAAPAGFSSGAGVLSLPARSLRSAVRTLPQAGSLSDRLLRSRAWIGLVAGLLIGLVFLQVSLLKINAGIGQSVQQASTLESANAVLRAQNNALAEEGRVTMEAEKLGLQMPTAAAIRYLKAAAPGGVGGAAGAVLSADEAAAQDGTDTGATDPTAVGDGSGDAVATEPADTSQDTSTDAYSAPDATSDTSEADTGSDSTAVADSGGGSPDSGGAVAPAG